MSSSIGRNDACHCGSGKKYKNCCLKKDKSSMKSNIGVGLLIVVVLLGLWLLGTAISKDDGAIDCPVGKTWSQAHQHCH
ncbi:hypothetical protein GYB29_08905 [bacterium]|jgi:hypothetical protein|nr:SEC-C domain-containing protein [Balneola sp.]MBR9917780.1 hypothetical protein [bacterium]